MCVSNILCLLNINWLWGDSKFTVLYLCCVHPSKGSSCSLWLHLNDHEEDPSASLEKLSHYRGIISSLNIVRYSFRKCEL